MPLNPKVQIKSTGIHGHCWFAAADIKQDEHIWWKRPDDEKHTDIFLTRKEIDALPDDKRLKFLSLCYQVSDDLHCGFDPDLEPIQSELIEDYINHSCCGNTWYTNPDLLVASRYIKSGEEITYDYVMTEADPTWRLADKCLCGAENCRGNVTGNDWKIKELQEKLKGHFFPHVQKKIDDATKQDQQ
ncbi:unnamed protein product [Didymodactylos carnosus]|uniref:Post-SET domain-containing protein n=1 Tax=Didymodactylos carnosus TaxID=1234261 RepID=A0A815JEH2_9BILA|nr:unnamed protein product [Didymodactylos carnosus]CAF1379809.1 unnamed protein product [Didymodactylos carnosus]CAF4029990.1 unnamed protein product [Didymodactylos carnosus]CAF4273596.1 unnamed protein product [Didymodactylos carnosus]